MRYITLAIISVMCLLASCSVEGGKDIFDVPYTGYTLFEADFENVDMLGEQSDFLLNIQDGIGVFGSGQGVNEKYTLKKAFDGKAAGEFYGPVVSGEKIMAYYPYTEGMNLYDGTLPYTISPAQSYSQNVSVLDHFLAYSEYAYAFAQNDNKLRFGYMSGLLVFEVAFVEPVTVTSIELISEGANIAGMGKVNPDKTVSMGESGSKHLTVDFGEGIISNVDGKSSIYPVVLPAGNHENIKLVLNTVEMGEILCVLAPFAIERISAGDYRVTELVVKVGALGGFEVEGDLEFESES